MLVDAHTHLPSKDLHVRVYSVRTPPLESELQGPFTIGLHPWDIPRAQESDQGFIRRLSEHPACVGIGETGLDRARPIDWKLQESWLDWHWNLAEERGLPLVLHVVRSSSDLLQKLTLRRPRTPWLWHDFTGPVEVIKSVLRAHPQIVFSFGGRGIQRKDFRTLWESVPTGHRLIETDEAPTPLSELYALVNPSESELEQTFRTLWGLSN